jgi:hypothetical protein
MRCLHQPHEPIDAHVECVTGQPHREIVHCIRRFSHTHHTIDRYAHVTEDMETEPTERLEALLAQELNR